MNKITQVIAVDFDGTLCSSAYPRIGEVKNVHKRLHSYIRQRHEANCIIILWTCREGEQLVEALEWCERMRIPIDYANENTPSRIAYGGDCRKISADIYIDDKSINPL